MKKVLFIAVAASVAFAACTKNEVRSVESQQDRQITFQAVVNKASTKAVNENTFTNNAVYPSSSTFGTFAYFYTTTFTTGATASDTYINNAEVKHKYSVESNTSSPANGWTTDTPYYWPKQGKLTFYSYSPYSINTGDNVSCDIASADPQGIKISSWDVDANQTVDIMIADRIDDQTNNTADGTTGWNGVPTVFRHKLAQVVAFNVKTKSNYATGSAASPAIGDKYFYLQSIEIGNVAYKGGFTSGIQPSSTNIGSWTKTSDKVNVPYVWYNNDTGNTTATAIDNSGITSPKSGSINTNGYLLVLPQEMTAKSGSETDYNVEYIEIVYTIRTFWGTGVSDYSDETVTQTVDLKSVSPKWEINKLYTYNITISLDQIYWDPSVVDWEDGTTTNITI